MKLEKLKAFGKWIAEHYIAVEHYFTQGSFGIKFYPFLMHPCVRKTHSSLIKIFAVLIVFSGLYYIFGELMVVLFSDKLFTAYINHSPLELLLSPEQLIQDQNGSITPLSYTMRSAYLLQMWIVLLGYFICVTHITGHRFRLLGILFSFLFYIGLSIIHSSQGGSYTSFGYLHNLGFEITFLVGNLTMIIIGLGINKTSAKRFKYYSWIGGFIGAICMGIPMFIETAYTPILERISIYCIMIWEIALGFAVLRETD